MANDADWVEDIRRWYQAGTQAAASLGLSVPDTTEPAAIGYEAAHPALQARNWPAAPETDFAPPALTR